jgi:UDP-N-acetyl-D-glucosamine dehydrogenase
MVPVVTLERAVNTTGESMARDLLGRIQRRDAKIAVIGQGYVGLPLAMRASTVGYRVVGFEVAPDRVASLLAGRSHVGDVSDGELNAALARGYLPTEDENDLEAFDVAVISVPTPLMDGLPDLSFIESAAVTVGRRLVEGACVVLESTTYPGTTEELVAPILERESGLTRDRFLLGYSPERIDPGNPNYSFENTPKVVSGDRPESLEVVDTFFSSLVNRTVPVANCAEAELVKLLENTFRHVNIALINELAKFARGLDVDIWRAIDAAATKPFGFMRFTPGPGVGGHCLPIDPSYLAWRVREHLGQNFRFVELANDINDHMPDYVQQRISDLLARIGKPVNGASVLLLGLAYKASTSDWRESPSVKVAHLLADAGAQIMICDPHVEVERAGEFAPKLAEFSDRVLSSVDLVVVLVDHPEFIPEFVATHAPLIFDAKNHLAGVEFSGETL